MTLYQIFLFNEAKSSLGILVMETYCNCDLVSFETITLI
jgi:hypothetical protein